MTGLEIIRDPGTTAEQIVDIVSEHCPPVVPANCDDLPCRECWLAWLTIGKPPKENGDPTSPDYVDLAPIRRVGRAELSGDDPYKPVDKRAKRLALNKDSNPSSPE